MERKRCAYCFADAFAVHVDLGHFQFRRRALPDGRASVKAACVRVRSRTRKRAVLYRKSETALIGVSGNLRQILSGLGVPLVQPSQEHKSKHWRLSDFAPLKIHEGGALDQCSVLFGAPISEIDRIVFHDSSPLSSPFCARRVAPAWVIHFTGQSMPTFRLRLKRVASAGRVGVSSKAWIAYLNARGQGR